MIIPERKRTHGGISISEISVLRGNIRWKKLTTFGSVKRAVTSLMQKFFFFLVRMMNPG